MCSHLLDQVKSLHTSLKELMEKNGREFVQELLNAVEFVELLSVLKGASEEEAQLDIQVIVTPPLTSSSSMLFPAISSLSSLSQHDRPEAPETVADQLAEDPPPAQKTKRVKKEDLSLVKPAPSISRSSPMDDPVHVIEPEAVLHEVRYRAPWTDAQDKMLLEGHDRGLTGRPLAYFVGGFHSTDACNSRLKRLQSLPQGEGV